MLVESLKGGNHLKDLGIDRRIILFVVYLTTIFE
jgi:hypothetical protein